MELPEKLKKNGIYQEFLFLSPFISIIIIFFFSRIICEITLDLNVRKA